MSVHSYIESFVSVLSFLTRALMKLMRTETISTHSPKSSQRDLIINTMDTSWTNESLHKHTLTHNIEHKIKKMYHKSESLYENNN